MRTSTRNKGLPVRFPEPHEIVHDPVKRQEIDFSGCPLAYRKFGHSIERHGSTHPKWFAGTRGNRWASS